MTKNEINNLEKKLLKNGWKDVTEESKLYSTLRAIGNKNHPIYIKNSTTRFFEHYLDILIKISDCEKKVPSAIISLQKEHGISSAHIFYFRDGNCFSYRYYKRGERITSALPDYCKKNLILYNIILLINEKELPRKYFKKLDTEQMRAIFYREKWNDLISPDFYQK